MKKEKIDYHACFNSTEKVHRYFIRKGFIMAKELDTNHTQCTLSFELLKLMQWWITQEPGILKKMITNSLENGLRDYLKAHNDMDAFKEQAALHHNIVDFFSCIETLLNQSLEEHKAHDALQRQLIPDAHNIDGISLRGPTIKESLAHATQQYLQKQDQSPRQLLFKEVLKRWKPSKKTSVH